MSEISQFFLGYASLLNKGKPSLKKLWITIFLKPFLKIYYNFFEYYIFEVPDDFLLLVSSCPLLLTVRDVSWSSVLPESPSLASKLRLVSMSVSAMEASLVTARESWNAELMEERLAPPADLSRFLGSSNNST